MYLMIRIFEMLKGVIFMKKTVQLLLVAALALSLSLNGMTALAEDSSAPETSSAVTVETKDGETEKKPDTKETEQQESGQKETSSQQTTSETPSSSQAAESSQTTANSGTYENVTWKIDAKAKTLTLEKINPDIGSGVVASESAQFPWSGREQAFPTLILNGYVDIFNGESDYFFKNFKTVKTYFNETDSCAYDIKTRTLTLNGKGMWSHINIGTSWFAENLVIGDEITGIKSGYNGFDYVHLGKKVNQLADIQSYTGRGFTVDEANPYYSVYANCLYNKEYTTLLGTPWELDERKFHPAVKYLYTATVRLTDGESFVVPWGITTLEKESILGKNNTVVLPDTLTTVPDNFLHTKNEIRTYIVSKNNRTGFKAGDYPGDYIGKITVQVVDSVAKYYPGQVGPEGGETSTVPGPSGEPESSQPSPGPSGGTSQPTTSKPTTSQPSTSKPATSQPSTSKPATSQPTSKPATSQQAPSQSVTSQPESSVPIESSQSAESSQPQSNSESLELSVDPSSDTDESTAVPVENKATGGWVVPVVMLVIAAAVAAGVIVLRIRKKQ